MYRIDVYSPDFRCQFQITNREKALGIFREEGEKIKTRGGGSVFLGLVSESYYEVLDLKIGVLGSELWHVN